VCLLSTSGVHQTGLLLHQLGPVSAGRRQVSAHQRGPPTVHTPDLRVRRHQQRQRGGALRVERRDPLQGLQRPQN